MSDVDSSEPEMELTAESIRLLLADAGVEATAVQVHSAVTAGANRQTLRIRMHPGPQEAIAQIAVRDIDESWLLPVLDEAAVLRMADAGGVRVPQVLAAGHSPLLGADLLVTRFVSGETIPRRVLRSLSAAYDGAETMAASCGRTLAVIHQLDPTSVVLTKPLDCFKPAGYIEHLRQRLEELPSRYPTFRFALNILADNLPEPPSSTLIHGDFRNGNLIVADGGIQAVLDWELVHLGDPMEDLAWLCLRTWRFGQDEHVVGGFTTLDRLRAAYQEHGGHWRQDGFDWWTMARTVWWGIGLAAQAARFVDGRSTSIVHAASGRRVVELEYDLLNLLDPLIR